MDFSQLAPFFVRSSTICFSLLIHIIYISLFSHFSLIVAKSMLNLLSAICFDDFYDLLWHDNLLSVRLMTGIAIVGKISLIIHLIQHAFPDVSIGAIASAASMLFIILFILCDCQAMRFMLFPNASDQKIIYPPWEPPPDMFAKEASQNTSSLESARLSSFFNVTTISSVFILLTNLFALLASSVVGLLIFPSKSQHSKRISDLAFVANQLNCPIKAWRLCISVSLSKSYLSLFPSNFKDSMEST